MTVLDYFVLLLYAVGMLIIGSILSKKNKNSADMFAVSKQAPWWLSGVSAFMSAFSAGTFVVWGGVAYKEGAVAISILMSLGVSSFIVGKFLAAKWASLGINTVGEYVNIRFGREAVQFYTWIGALFKIVAMAVALYAFATLFCSLIPLDNGNVLQDPSTGKLSITYACIISGLLMLVYAISGGLWAVLIIDSIQFVVLMITVLFVVPLCFAKVGGVGNFLEQVPPGFLSPASGKFTYWFLMGWIVIHAFKFGGEWVFIQRFLAVSNPKNAKKSSYLFGTLYLISPVIWMLPPMIYRIIDPNANPEQAYFLACAAVLPAGMMGLLLAAMFSSAASYIDGEINVYAGAVTDDFYKLIINPKASEKQLLLVGRISSFLIGAVIICGAVLIPYIGGAEKVILTITSLLVVPMVLPVIWGLFFGKITQRAVWVATIASFIAAILVKTTIPLQSESVFVSTLIKNIQTLEVAVGVIVPLSILLIMEATRKEIAVGFLKLLQMEKAVKNNEATVVVAYPAKILAYSIGILSLLMYVLMFSAEDKMLLVGLFGAVLTIISLSILFGIRKIEKNK